MCPPQLRIQPQAGTAHPLWQLHAQGPDSAQPTAGAPLALAEKKHV